ncbi:uncharacterized protein [Littorina saxatilis]|uniref:Uncharacterized protein n=1 Tax=Littorina saxatilis TaxID=31220 RepID=A0AAN9AZV7_9CAEN
MRSGKSSEAPLTQALASVEGALVLLLYLSLLTEIIAMAMGRYSDTSNDNSKGKGGPSRPPVVHVGKKSCGMCHDKKNIRSLDNLWRRMQKATNQMRLVNLRHHMITKVMMEARMQAREREREKLHQKKEKLFAGVLKPGWGTAVRGV